jgi:hypothetical protein
VIIVPNAKINIHKDRSKELTDAKKLRRDYTTIVTKNEESKKLSALEKTQLELKRKR